MVGHIAVQPKPAEPAVGQIEMNLLAEPKLRADAEAIADQQHPDHQFGLDQRAPDHAVVGASSRLSSQTRRTYRSSATDDQRERAAPARTHRTTQPVHLPMPHHDSVLS